MLRTFIARVIDLLTRYSAALTGISLAVILAGTLWPFNFAQPNGVALTPLGIAFGRHSTAYLSAPSPLPDRPDSFTISVRFTPADVTSGESGLVFGYAKDFLRQNVILAQVGTTVGFKFALSDGSAHHIWANCLTGTDPVTLTLTSDGARTVLSCNGEIKNEQTIAAGRRIAWDRSLPFAFGSDGTGAMPWRGTITRVMILPGVHRGAIDSATASTAWMDLDFTQSPTTVLERVHVPATFRPATKPTLLDTITYWRTRRFYVADLVINVLLFVPLGVSLALALRRRPWRGITRVAVVALYCLGFTLLIEFLQTQLPTRFPSLSDVMTNVFGGTAGAVAATVIAGWGAAPSRRRRPKKVVFFTKRVLDLDATSEIARISERIRVAVGRDHRKRGAVVAVSGGIDSAVCLALCVKALGPERVFALLLPERSSSPESTEFGLALVQQLGVRYAVEDISSALEASGCYRAQVEAIRSVVPSYGQGWKHKVILPSILEGDRLNVTRLVVEAPDGDRTTHRLPAAAYLQLIAATNFKQRTRKMLEYYHADRLNYAVCGTPNRLEYDQGFFVKLGDGAADFKPIAHLYKTQVFAIGRALGIPDGILQRTPTTDTFSIPQTQEEFYYSLPYQQMDLCLFALNHDVSPSRVADVLGLTVNQVERVYNDLRKKRITTRPLHLPPQLVEPVSEIDEMLEDDGEEAA